MCAPIFFRGEHSVGKKKSDGKKENTRGVWATINNISKKDTSICLEGLMALV